MHKEWLNAALSVVSDAAIATDSQGNVLCMNSFAEELSGWSSSQATGLSSSVVINTDDDQRLVSRSGVAALFTAEQARVESIENAFLGTLIVLRPLRTMPAEDESSKLGVAELRAQVAAAQLEAQRANLAKDKFLAMLGHELRNPLAPILTALQLIRIRTSGILDREQEILERQVKNIVTLVDDLMDVSRITQGKLEVSLQSVDLAEPLERALEATAPMLQARSHSVKAEILQGALVNGDPYRLTQVFSNLLVNAAKYTPPGGLINVKMQHVEGQVTVVVQDSGVGITPDFLPQLFERFVQGEQQIDRAQGGLGLGLAIVKSLVGLHGGQVMARSDGLGKGSEFTVVLPAFRQGEVVPPLKAMHQDLGEKFLKVLLVDDNEDALAMLAEALQLLGYQTFSAASSFAALGLAESVQPDIALLDIGLPDVDGYELARRLRALPGLESIKLVALTGYSQASDRAKTAAAGFDEHLVKPSSLEQLQKVIERLTTPATVDASEQRTLDN